MPFFRKVSFWQRLVRANSSSDAAVQHGLWRAGRSLGAGYTRYGTALERLQMRGAARAAVDLLSVMVTLGTVGLLLMLTLAVPAMRETDDENWLKKQDLAITFLDRYGTEIGKRGIRHDDSVGLQDYPEYFVQAVLATEDRRFHEHFGIDVIGTFRALAVNARANSVVQGGSSITQQLAKNLFLSNQRSIERKVKEAFLALWLESRLSKQDILKLYLDRAYMGGGTFGAQAAAEFYFGKRITEVSLAEAAMLAGLFKAPTKYAPHVNLPAARARANDVLGSMVAAGFLTDGQVYAARRNPASAIDRKRDVTPDYYLDWAYGEVKRLADEGRLGEERVLVVKTGLDLDLQKRTESAIESIIRQYGQQYEVGQAAAVLMEPDGIVRAMVGGRDYGTSQFNRATDGLRQPGSSFKTFVYTTAFMSGRFNATSVVTDRPTCIGNWCPQNYNRSYGGSMPIVGAFARSINTIPVQMSIRLGQDEFPDHVARAARLGRDRIVATAKAMGLNTDLKDTPSLPIGSAEVTALDMAAGYATLAGGGRKAEPHAAIEIRTPPGELVYRHDRDAKPAPQVVPQKVAQDMNLLLSKVNEEGTGRRAALPGIRSAGKTGTTNGYKDAWYIGFTGNYVASVWYGNDDSSPTDNMTGGTLPAMTWHEIMTYAHAGIELKAIPGVVPMEAVPASAAVASARPAKGADADALRGERPAVLSRRSNAVITGIEDLFRTTGERRQAGLQRRADAAADEALGPGGPQPAAALR